MSLILISIPGPGAVLTDILRAEGYARNYSLMIYDYIIVFFFDLQGGRVIFLQIHNRLFNMDQMQFYPLCSSAFFIICFRFRPMTERR